MTMSPPLSLSLLSSVRCLSPFILFPPPSFFTRETNHPPPKESRSHIWMSLHLETESNGGLPLVTGQSLLRFTSSGFFIN